jgi:solute carrier family 25 S-adenosylmethionine transporter 26
MDLMFPNVDLVSNTAAAANTVATTTAALHQRTSTTRRIIRIQKAYRGVVPATLGAIPSSAIYFGAYETMKTCISKIVPDNTFSSRLTIHALAAASGNALSSLIFVPKELIKQQLQYSNTSTIRSILSSTLKESGIRGLYCGYQATLIRNIPSAIIRFVLYEEFKYKCISDDGDHHSHTSSSSSSSSNFHHTMLPKLFLAGALAGAIASGFMTPVDVIKTRLATKTIPTKGFVQSLQYLMETEGLRALYAGAPSRMIWSGAFSAIGFGTFETAKTALGVTHTHTHTPTRSS